MKTTLVVLWSALALAIAAAGLAGDAPPYRAIADIPYAHLPGVDVRLTSLDIYTPLVGSGLPVAVWVHGGSWSAGDKGNVGEKPRAFTSAGYVLVSINYRLSPAVRHPAHVQDVAAAIAWVHGNIARYGGDPSRIFLIGHSAGAHLVALVATDGSYLAAHGLGLNAIRGVVCLEGLYNIAQRMEEGVLAAGLLLPKVFGDEPALWWSASPLAHVAPGKELPPFLVIHARSWVAAERTAAEFASALTRAGAKADLYHAADKDHAGVNRDLGLSGDEMTARVFAFLAGVQVQATENSLPAQVLRDLEYARVDGKSLRLDLYLPRL